MRLKRLGALRPETPEPKGTFAGWFLPKTNYLADATAETIRVWDIKQLTLLNAVTPASTSLGRPNGAITVFPNTHRVITAHENAVKPFQGMSVVVWQLPELRPVLQRPGHAAIDPGISMGAQRRHVATFSADEASATTPGLIVWDLKLNPLAKWKDGPKGEPLPIEDREWVVDSRCRKAQTGVEIRGYDGRLVQVIADDRPVTHQLRAHDNELWLFQEEGRLDRWDLDSMKRSGEVNLGHTESMRDDFPTGAVVCLDDLDPQTVATLGTDGTVKFWHLPDWACLAERPFEMLPLWIDVDRDHRLLAVGFEADGIELFSIE
jgi:WD40 repeat protein